MGMTHTYGHTEYLVYQEFGGYDLLRVSGKLSIYKKKILQKATQVENIYGLDPDTCCIQFKKKDKKIKDSKKDIKKLVSNPADASCSYDKGMSKDVPVRHTAAD